MQALVADPKTSSDPVASFDFVKAIFENTFVEWKTELGPVRSSVHFL